MLKREDLEELRDLRGTEWGLVDSRGKTEVDFDAPVQAEMSALLAAAPKLALACLEALRYVEMWDHSLTARLRAALAAAGVEVE